MAEDNSELNPELCVIGAGAGGLAAAAAAAAFGVPVVLIEKGQMGGERLNTGSRAVEGADRGGQARQRRRAMRRMFGVKARALGVDFAAVKAHVRRVIDAIAPNEMRRSASPASACA